VEPIDFEVASWHAATLISRKISFRALNEVILDIADRGI
jgi:hypothetical protein